MKRFLQLALLTLVLLFCYAAFAQAAKTPAAAGGQAACPVTVESGGVAIFGGTNQITVTAGGIATGSTAAKVGPKATATRKRSGDTGTKAKVKTGASSKKKVTASATSFKMGPRVAKAAKGLILVQAIIEVFNYAQIKLGAPDTIAPKISLSDPTSLGGAPVYKVSILGNGILPIKEFFVQSNANDNIFADQRFLEKRLSGGLAGFKNVSVVNSFYEQLASTNRGEEIVSSVRYEVYKDNGETPIFDGACSGVAGGFDCDLAARLSDLGDGKYELFLFVEAAPMVIGTTADKVNDELLANRCNYLNAGQDWCDDFEGMLPTEKLFAEIDQAKADVLADISYWDNIKSVYNGLGEEWVDVKASWKETGEMWSSSLPWYYKLAFGAKAVCATIKAPVDTFLSPFTFAASPLLTKVTKVGINHVFNGFKQYDLASRAMMIGMPVVIPFEKGGAVAAVADHVVRVEDISAPEIMTAAAGRPGDFISLKKADGSKVTAEITAYTDLGKIEIKVYDPSVLSAGEKLTLNLEFSKIDSRIADQKWELTYRPGQPFKVEKIGGGT